MSRKLFNGLLGRKATALRPLLALGLTAVPLAAGATDISFRIEPGVTIPLTAPQSDVYGVGGSQTLKLGFGLGRYLDVGPSASFTLLPANAALAESGVAWTFGGGLRLKRPYDAEGFYGISPWLDADALYVRTGANNRPGFSAAVGASIPFGERRAVRAGPFVRYLQTMQPERAGFDNRDAKLLTLGISFELGAGVDKEHVHEQAEPLPAEIRTVTNDVVSCPDADGDTLPDNIDRCPAVPGQIDNWGCPPYEKVIVKRDKLELKEKLYFAWDEATLEPVSFPVLDEVVQALKDNKNFRVQVEGHTDSSGGDTHNQTLSEKRAEAVLNYLVSHGVGKERLVSKGFSSSVPSDTNTTSAGRENNRRVEFVVNFIIIEKGSVK